VTGAIRSAPLPDITELRPACPYCRRPGGPLKASRALTLGLRAAGAVLSTPGMGDLSGGDPAPYSITHLRLDSAVLVAPVST
jgi:hypothetical protein